MSMRDIFQGSPFGGGGGEPRRQIRPLRFRKSVWILFGIVLLLAVVIPATATFYTDMLWFRERGLSQVFWTRLIPQWILFAVAAVAAFAIFSLNWLKARRSAIKDLASSLPEEAGDMPLRASAVVVAIIAGALAVMNGLGIRSEWMTVLQFFNRTPFGKNDPLFGKDIAFYVFEIPFLSMLQGWLLNTLIMALMGVALIVFLAAFPKMREENRIYLPSHTRSHLSILGAVTVLVWGAGMWLERFNLLLSPEGVVFGAGYTDVHVRLFAINVMIALSVIVAALLVANLYKRTWRLAIAGGILLVGASFLLRGVVPGIIQKYVVEPNEFSKERPYIEFNINSTLEAYGLDSLEIIDFSPENAITRENIDNEPDTIRNIRLWDYRPLLRAFKQLQEIRTYYDFPDVDIARYTFDGSYRQVMLAARELDHGQLQNPTWVNRHLEFTHGYGIVMNFVNEVDSAGKPVLIVKDLPPQMSVPLRIEKPQIYYGEKTNPYSLVRTSILEFDYPMGDANVRTTYEGTGGVPIGNLFRRIMFALRYRDSEILFTNVITSESRVLMYRSIRERLDKVAPFLLYDSDPYLAIIDGRLVWIQDAYTATDRYPYSNPVSVTGTRQRINYIRNSIKAVVDAYDGSILLYISDGEDPMIRTWAGIFPALFTPIEDAHPELCTQIRYPMAQFLIQSEIFRTYHMSDPNTFYNKEDVWRLDNQTTTGSLNAYYLIMRLVGEEKAEFALIAPFMPVGRDNMIAWMAGRSDVPNYGQLLVYQFPKQQLIFGPSQVAALIDQDPEISAQLSLWTQRGSDVIRGDIMVIPLDDALLYVQALYLRAENSDLPELKRVIVSSGGKVAWAETVDEALSTLLLRLHGAGLPRVAPPETAPGEERPAARLPVIVSGTARDLAGQARDHFDEAQRASRMGDWARYGEELEKLREVLEALLEETVPPSQ
ncbi:MAG TPA: UPF0182 family protein [Synergistales bacterium]|nr:UPF0182 family protein [Synergistales bacterium]